MEFDLDSLKDLKVVITLKVDKVQVHKEDNTRKIADYMPDTKFEIGEWDKESQEMMDEIYNGEKTTNNISFLDLNNVGEKRMQYLWDLMHILIRADFPPKYCSPMTALAMVGVLGMSKKNNYKVSLANRRTEDMFLILADWVHIRGDEIIEELKMLEEYSVIDKEEIPLKDGGRYYVYSLTNNMLRFFDIKKQEETES